MAVRRTYHASLNFGNVSQEIQKKIIEEKITRKKALERGFMFYYSECSRCESKIKYTNNYICPNCQRERYKERHKEKYSKDDLTSLREKRKRLSEVDESDFEDDYYNSLLED